MKYHTIVADPPWPLAWNANVGSGRSGHKGLPYPTMQLNELAALSVNALTEKSAHLWIWATHTFLLDARQLATAWGFTPTYLLTWMKPGLGMGGRFRHTCEYVWFCEQGPTLPIKRTDVGTWFHWSRRDHSTKPEAFYDLVESVSHEPYLELFARRNRLGWDTWGNESLEMVNL